MGWFHNKLHLRPLAHFLVTRRCHNKDPDRRHTPLRPTEPARHFRAESNAPQSEQAAAAVY